ncbi:MAG TPA: cupredoxin domain-containing protein [Stellaceae bacterium]|nr:cupredoxin domain-containing protein [Stellaceae bacterium]
MAALLAGCVAAEQASRKSPESNVQTVQMTAERFKYTPDEITVKKGVPVDLVLTTKDRVHGFYVPELGLRAEIKPGETEHVRFTPDKAGKFTMECDIFCGEGHESMDGTITVE